MRILTLKTYVRVFLLCSILPSIYLVGCLKDTPNDSTLEIDTEGTELLSALPAANFYPTAMDMFQESTSEFLLVILGVGNGACKSENGDMKDGIFVYRLTLDQEVVPTEDFLFETALSDKGNLSFIANHCGIYNSQSPEAVAFINDEEILVSAEGNKKIYKCNLNITSKNISCKDTNTLEIEAFGGGGEVAENSGIAVTETILWAVADDATHIFGYPASCFNPDPETDTECAAIQELTLPDSLSQAEGLSVNQCGEDNLLTAFIADVGDHGTKKIYRLGLDSLYENPNKSCWSAKYDLPDPIKEANIEAFAVIPDSNCNKALFITKDTERDFYFVDLKESESTECDK